MNGKQGFALGAALALGAAVYLTAPGKVHKEDKIVFDGKNFAHRGLHREDKSVPENSLTAFRLAAEKGYGIELDVQLSKDGQVVVFHDDTLNRVCGVDARVDELTFPELRKLRLCGSEETIPLFSEVLATVRGRGALIVELKTGKRNTELCEKTCALLRSYKGEYCIESFNPLIVRWFKKNASEIFRGQLAWVPKEYDGQVSKPLGIVLGNVLLNFLARPQFIAYKIGPKPLTVRLCEALGAVRFCWTSHDPANEKNYDAVIFEFYEPERKFK